jgi:hypothetical protein
MREWCVEDPVDCRPNPRVAFSLAMTAQRRWVVLEGKLEDSDELDLTYWLEHTTPVERVEAVHLCLVDSLRTQGKRVPRFRRVHRLVERAEGALPDRRRIRRRVSRAPSGNEGRGRVDRSRKAKRA